MVRHDRCDCGKVTRMRLILLRHGQTQSNVDHLIDTAVPGPFLTELGHAEAAAVPGALVDQTIDAIYVSTQHRSQQTGAPLSKARTMEPNIRDGIREISAGDYDGKTDKETVAKFVAIEAAWVAGQLDLRMPGADTGREVIARFDGVVKEAFDAGHESVIFVSHGSMIRTWAAFRAENIAADFVPKNPLHNTGMIVLEGNPTHGWKVITWVEEAIGGAAVDDQGAAGATSDNAPK
jgi:broad specificity phosphatase PhoE